MSSSLRSLAAALFLLTALTPTAASAQSSAIDLSVALSGVRLFSDSAAPLDVSVTTAAQEQALRDTLLATAAAPRSSTAAPARRQGANGNRDSVLDGILIGAGLGAAGGALGALLWCQGDYKGECDDEPGQGALIGTTALIGAGAGAVLGWVFDLNRSPRHANGSAVESGSPVLVVAPIASPSVKALRLTLRY